MFRTRVTHCPLHDGIGQSLAYPRMLMNPPIHGHSRVVATLEQVTSLATTLGVTLYDTLATLFGLLASAYNNQATISIVTRCEGWFEPTSIATISLDPKWTLVDATRGWRVTNLDRDTYARAPGLFLAALSLPAVGLESADFDSLIALEGEFPMVGRFLAKDGNVTIAIGPRAKIPAIELERMTMQLAWLVRRCLGHPELTLRALLEGLPPTGLELIVAANFGVQLVVPAIKELAEQIGVASKVSTVPLGGVIPAPPRATFPAIENVRAYAALIDETDWRDAASSVDIVQHRAPATLKPADIEQLNANETRELFDEIFVRRRYLRHGVDVAVGDIVLDVGANIGVFSLFVHHSAPDVTVHAIEPATEPYAALASNFKRYGIRGCAHNFAAGAQAGTTSLRYYPRATLQSGLYAEPERDRRVARQYARARFRSSDPTGIGYLPTDLQVRSLVDWRYDQQLVPIGVRTVSDLIEEHGLERIGLLKIDVERAEHRVLEGIRGDHWSRIEQVVVETHDLDGRVAWVRSLLERYGFSVVVEQDDLFVGTELFMVYGRRPERASDRSTRNVVGAIEMLAQHASGRIQAVVCYRDPAVAGELMAHLRTTTPASVKSVHRGSDGSAVVETQPTWPAQVANEMLRAATEPLRAPVKAIAVDADGTLWAGVCTEDGPHNLRVTAGHAELQQALLRERESGVLLFLVTKNDIQDVQEAFVANTSMPLRMEHFSAVRAAWLPKSRAIKGLLDEYRIRPDAMLFVDDSPQERLEVKLHNPGVAVLDLPDDPARFADAIRACWLLNSQPLTHEDHTRAAFYAEDAARSVLASKAPTFREYLHALSLNVRMYEAHDRDVDRIHQLSRRTNQFNLSARQYSREDMQQLLLATWRSLAVQVTDTYGDYGMVGFVAMRHAADQAEVLEFWLSCRALGRNVEWAIIAQLGGLLRKEAVKWLTLRARPSGRNGLVLSFLRQLAQHTASSFNERDCSVTVRAAAAEALVWHDMEPATAREAAPAVIVDPADADHDYRWPGLVRPHNDATRTRLAARPDLLAPFEAPVGDIEQRIAEICARCGYGWLGRHDSLFAAGGDSIAAIVICTEVGRAFGRELPVDEYLPTPTIAQLARLIDAEPYSRGLRLERAVDSSSAPASFGQRRIWYAEVTARSNSQIIPLVFRLRGAIDSSRLEAAIAGSVQNRPTLRTSLQLHNGTLFQAAGSVRFSLQRMAADAAGACLATDKALEEFFACKLDPASGHMIRAVLIEEANDAHVLGIALHHAAADGWSVGLLLQEISNRYEGIHRFEPADQMGFAAYARAVAMACSEGRYDVGIEYLKRQIGLAGGPLAPRPDRSSRQQAPAPAFRRFGLSNALVAGLERSARSLGTTPAMLSLSMFQLLLALHSGRPHSIVGYPVANRTHSGLTDTVGFFSNIVPIAISIDWNVTFATYLAQSGRAALDALRYSDVPYGKLLTEIHGDDSIFLPPFEALVTIQNQPTGDFRLSGCQVDTMEPPCWPLPFDLMIDLDLRSASPSCLVRWDDAVFAPSTMQWLYDGFALLTDTTKRAPRAPIRVLRELLLERKIAFVHAAAAPQA